MPRKRASKTAHSLADLDEPAHQLKSIPLAKPLPADSHISRGLAAFPLEILLEIVSHYSEISLPTIRMDVFPRSYPIHRPNALRALSQACRSLRTALLPILWQRIEACATTRISDRMGVSAYKRLREQWQKDVASDLMRQMRIVLRNPELATHVRWAS